MAVKKLIQDQPKFGDLSQYNFDDSTGNYDYENSAGLPKNTDKFENKDLFTKSAGNELNNVIIERNLKTEGISQIKINTLRINNNDVNRDCKSNDVRCYMFSQEYADADNQSYSGISSIISRNISDDNGGGAADRFYKKTDSHVDEGQDFGTIIENQILIQNLKSNDIELEDFSDNTPEYNANYMLPLKETNSETTENYNTSIIDESISNPIYIVIYMKGNSDNNYGADAERKKKFTIFRINNLELFNYDNSGNAIAKSTTFQYRQGQGITQGEWTKYSVENSGDLKPAWTVGEFELQIDTNLSSPNDWDFNENGDVLPGDPDVDTPDEKLYKQYFSDVQPPYVFNRNEIKLVDLLNLSPSRQLNNIDQAGNNKTNLFPDYFPQTTINVVNQNNQPQDLDLQSYYYDTVSSIKGSAPATVSIFFNIINPDDETLIPDQNFYYFIIDWDDKDDTIKTLQDWEDNRPTNLDDLIQLQQENLYIMYSAKSVEQILTLDTSYPTPNPYELFPDSLGFEQQGNMPPFLQATISTATQACIELGHSGQNNVEADASSTPPGTVYWDDGNQQWDTIPIPNAYITNLDCLSSTQFYTENPSLIRKSYTTPGIKTIKSIVFSYDDMTNQVGRWKLVTSRFFLDIPINQYPDFAEVGGSDYTIIPWPYTTPVIGGVDNDSKYKKSVRDTLSGGKILDTELIDERFLVNDLENDELGKSVKDMDLEQIRYFNKSYELNQLLNINPILSTLMEGDLSFLEDEYLLSLPYPEFFNQFDINQDAVLTSDDSDIWVNEYGRPDIAYEVSNIVSQVEEIQNQPLQELIGQVRMSRTQQYGFNYASAWFGELGEGYYDGSSNPDMANWQGLIPGGVDDPMDSYGQMGYELDNFSNHETCKYFYPQCLTQNCIAIFEDNNNQNNGPLFGNYVYDCYTTQDSVNSVLPPREHFVGLIGLARNTWESGEGYLDDNDGLWYGIGPFEDYYTFPDNVEQFVSHVGGYEFDIPNFACAEVFGGNAMSDGNVELGDYETTEFDSIVSKNGQIWKIYQCLDKRLLTSNDEPIIETPSESEYYNGQALGYYEFDYRPYNYINDDESLYWDGETNKFPEESSVGQIFITENQDLDLKQNCKLELNTGQLSGKSIYDSSGNSNKGLLIGDYKVKKVRKGEPMRRDSFIKVPKKTGNKDGAL
tara:strand:+ start:755 stop:4273 length:3519 start_codon:yes stop_codon:yes gene_type:complete